jgi:hypothetical protein
LRAKVNLEDSRRASTFESHSQICGSRAFRDALVHRVTHFHFHEGIELCPRFREVMRSPLRVQRPSCNRTTISERRIKAAATITLITVARRGGPSHGTHGDTIASKGPSVAYGAGTFHDLQANQG